MTQPISFLPQSLQANSMQALASKSHQTIITIIFTTQSITFSHHHQLLQHQAPLSTTTKQHTHLNYDGHQTELEFLMRQKILRPCSVIRSKGPIIPREREDEGKVSGGGGGGGGARGRGRAERPTPSPPPSWRAYDTVPLLSSLLQALTPSPPTALPRPASRLPLAMAPSLFERASYSREMVWERWWRQIALSLTSCTRFLIFM